jgi:outer membrane protein TolC
MKLKLLVISILFGTGLQAQDSVITARTAVDIAMQVNLRIDIARSEQDIARINNNWGNAGKWPTVVANLGNTASITNLNQKLADGTEINRTGVFTDITNANVVASWRIYNGMRIRATKQRFEELEKMGDILLQQEITRVTYDVLIAYYNIVRLNLQVKATGAIIELSREREKIAETRFNVGSAAKTDMLQASIDLNTVIANLENIYRQIETSKTLLNNLLKRAPDAPLAVADSTFDIRLINLEEYKTKIETQNFGMLLAQRDRAILVQDRRIINAQRLPMLTLNSVTSYNRTIATGGFFLTNQNFGPNLGLNLTIPIYNSNIFKTQLRANEAQQKQQLQVIEQVRMDSHRDMQIAFQEYQNALKVSDIEKANVKLAEENNFIATERFKKLQSNSIELRQAQESLSQAQDRYINARFRAKVAETTIELISGEVLVD